MCLLVFIFRSFFLVYCCTCILYFFFFFFSSRRRHTRSLCDWSDVCSSDLVAFHWLVAGTQGQNPHLAWKVPVWVTEEQARDVLLQTLHVFREDGSRERRDKARLRYLVRSEERRVGQGGRARRWS